MIFTSVTGHILNFQFPGTVANWQTTPIPQLFTEPVKQQPTDNGRYLIDNLSHFTRDADVLVLWLDCDTEGEAIAYEVIDICNRASRRPLQI